MATKLRVIKVKAFESKGEKHSHYTCAYKGRVFGISTMRFDEGDLTVEGDTITINTDIEVLKEVVLDQLTGETKQFLSVVPKVGLTLAEF